MTGYRNKRIILACSILLLAGLYCFGQAVRKRDDITEASRRALADNEEIALWVEGFIKGSLEKSTGNEVRWWKSEEEGRYYFFLPASADMNRLYMNMLGTDRVYLNGEPIENGGKFAVEPGDYDIRTDDGQIYPVTFLKSSNIDALFVETKQAETEDVSETGMEYLKADKSRQLRASAALIDSGGNLTYRGEVEYLRGRGNATWTETDKKSYIIKFENKADIAGMGEAKKWLLLPNCFDRSFLKNYLTYDIARKINLPYTPESIFVDWYVDGEYQGNYQLCEKIEINENRLDIRNLEKETQNWNEHTALSEFPAYVNGENGAAYTSKGFDIPANPEDITGGYLLELELNGRYQEEMAGFVTQGHEEVVIVSPEYASREQVNYISTYYEEAEAAILAADGVNPDTGKAFTDYLDVETFAKKYIIEELSKNVDAALSSQYMYKLPEDKGGMMLAGPVWDYDSAWGLGGERYGVNMSDPLTYYANIQIDEGSLWHGLYRQPVFYYYVCYFYQNEVLPTVREEFNIYADEYAGRIEDSVVMNFYRWGIADGENVEEKKDTFWGRVESIKSFANERMDFLEKEWRLE